MKKHFILATAVLASSFAFTQQDEKAPPPPPPPRLESKKLPPPPPTPPTPATIPQLIMPNDYADFLKRNKQVKSLEWKKEEKLTVHLESGGKEVYDLDNKDQVKKLEAKYGKTPETPPPPPPPSTPPPPPKPSKQQ